VSDGPDRIQPAPPAWYVRHRDPDGQKRQPPPHRDAQDDEQPPDDDEPKLIDVRV
jgi:hypothetical protein